MIESGEQDGITWGMSWLRGLGQGGGGMVGWWSREDVGSKGAFWGISRWPPARAPLSSGSTMAGLWG